MARAASGVPQGSVLGIILFVIFFYDLTDNLKIDYLLYADDVDDVPNDQRIGSKCSTLPKVNTSP